MCVPILRSIGTKLTNVENMQKSCFIWRNMTQKRYVIAVVLLIYIWIRNILQSIFFHVFGDLDLDIYSTCCLTK